MLVGVADDHAAGLSFAPADLIGLDDALVPFVVAVRIDRTDHDHARPIGQLGMVDDVAVLINGVFLETESAAQPFDRGGRIAVTQGWDDGTSGDGIHETAPLTASFGGSET